MQKGNPKQAAGSKKQAEFDSIFEQYAKALPKEYTQQFKKTENKVAAEKVKKREAQRTGKIEHVVKTSGNKHGEAVNISKLLEDDGIIEIKETPKEIAQQVARFRTEKNLTRDQLAKKISEPVSDVNDLENCVGVYKPNLVVKIEKALGVKIDRPWKKN